MHNFIYILYNKLSKRYESVMSFPSDELCIHRLKSNIDLEEFEVCRVGKVSIESGQIVPESPVRLVFGTVDSLCKKVE